MTLTETLEMQKALVQMLESVGTGVGDGSGLVVVGASGVVLFESGAGVVVFSEQSQTGHCTK